MGLRKAFRSVTRAVSNVVGSIGNAISSTVNAVVNVARSVVNTVGKVVNEVKKAVESIGKYIQPLVERYAIQAALMAMGIPPNIAAPMSAGLHTMAKGGSPEDALKSAATVVVVDKVGQTVAVAAKEAGYSATQIAAAQSAAQSAVATAAAGGDVNTILTAAAIGGVSASAGTAVLNETKNAQLAAFTQSAVNSALRKQKIDEAILNGASAATVSYLRQIDEQQKKADDVLQKRDAQYSEYSKKVDEYNSLVQKYNSATTQSEVDGYKSQLDAKLNEINGLFNSIGQLNQQLSDMQSSVNDLTKKAAAEIEKTGGEYSKEALASIKESEQALLAKIQEAASREFGDMENRLEYAAYDEGTRTDIPRIVSAGVYKIIAETPSIEINEAGIMFDKATGNVIGELTEDELFQLRQKLGLPTEQGTTISEGAPFGSEEQGGTSTIPSGGGQEFVNTGIQDLLMQQEFFNQQAQRAGEERTRLEALRDEATAALESAIPASRPQFEAELARINEEIKRVADIEQKSVSSLEEARAAESDLRASLGERKASETEKTFGRIERQTAADLKRFEQEQAAFEKELKRLEDELAKAENEAQMADVRQQFVAQTREKLRQAKRLPGTLEAQINSELESLLDEYEQAKGQATSTAAKKEALVAPQQPRAGGKGISDADVIKLLGLGEEEAARYGFTGTGTTEGGAGGEGTTTTPSTEEPPPEEAPTEEAPPEEGTTAGQGGPTMTNVTTMRPRAEFARGESPSISSRVTGESLVGILGEKEPLFGGDEDNQRAVWNRRSLRLRRALGL